MTDTSTPTFEIGDTVYLKGQSDPIVFLTVIDPNKPVDVGQMFTVEQVEVAGFDAESRPFRFCAPAAAFTTERPDWK